MTFEVKILGSNSAVAQHGRHPTSQLVNIHDKYFLVDCGEGTQMRMNDFKVKRFKINHIFISHLHGDHYYGLIGVITTFQLLQRIEPLTIYGPPLLEEIIQLQLKAGGTQLNYPLLFVKTQDSHQELLFSDADVEIFSFPLQHRIPTTGFLFVEKSTQRRINGEKTKGLTLLPKDFIDLKEGRDVTLSDGSFFKNDSLTLPPYPPRRYAFCSDTKFLPELRSIIDGVDLLYHEATFMNDAEKRANDTYHSTTGQAAILAEMAGVKHLIVGHFSSKYIELNFLLEEVRQIFPNSDLAIEGATFKVLR